MYLINVHTLELKDFLEGHIPPYAILSHRGGSEELNFKDVLKKRADKKLKGYQKLLGACRTTADRGIKYLWIDTCCIGKKSSAELSEAINSMYTWYEKANVCFAYLEDIRSLADAPFTQSVWFERAWTLQELIAPRWVEFYNAHWKLIGEKVSQAEAIQARTGIPHDILSKTAKLSDYCIAERMSWASDRQATRTEDITYSLTGIFDVNMPLLYGEGEKAFLRLQEEIIRRSDDHTFLLWGRDIMTSSLFATSPSEFRRDKRGYVESNRQINSFQLTNIGLDIEASLVRLGLGQYEILLGEVKEDNVRFTLHIRQFGYQKIYHKIGIVDVHIEAETGPYTDERFSLARGTAGFYPPDLILSEKILPPKRSYRNRTQCDLPNPIMPVKDWDSDWPEE